MFHGYVNIYQRVPKEKYEKSTPLAISSLFGSSQRSSGPVVGRAEDVAMPSGPEGSFLGDMSKSSLPEMVPAEAPQVTKTYHDMS